MLITPRVSEKTYALAAENIYVFDVPLSANKQQVAAAVASQYDVSVAAIRTAVHKGKAVRAYRGKRANPGTTQRKNTKKAYVTLVEGDTINVLGENEEENK